MIPKYPCLSAVALAAALGAQQGPDDTPRTPHAPTPAVEPLAPASADEAHPVPARPGAVRVPRVASPIHTAEADNGNEYGIWAAGADYKVSFHGPMTFVPYLGADYPHNQPFAWTTRSARIGSLELAHDARSPRRAQRGGFRYEYDLGGVIEAYDVLAEGLEQTFVIDQRPAGALGDLVVEGKIDSMMRSAARKAAHGALDFFDGEGRRIFTYGAAFAVDAHGVKVPMATAYADGIVTLSLAAQTLETLTFPVTVDPLLGNVTLRIGADIDPGMDCLREDEGLSDNVWYAYSRSVSSGDRDLYVWRRSDQWAGTDTAAYQDLTTSWETYDPAIASVSGANKVVTAFTRRFSGGDTWIRWHTHEYADLTLGTAYGSRGNVSGESTWRPDVGGTFSFSSGTTAILVFQRDVGVPLTNTATSMIATRALDVSGTGQGSLGPEIVLGNSTTRDFERPRICQQCEGGSSPVWGLVHQEYDNSITGDDWDVGFRIVDATGSTVSGPSFTEASSTDHKLGPVVAGQSGRFSVAYAIAPLANVNFKTGLTTGYDMRVRRVDYGTSISWGSTLSSLGDLGFTTSSRRWEPGGLAYDTDSDSHWMATFRSTSSNTAYCALSGYRGAFVLRETLYSSALEVNLGGVSYDDDGDEFVLQVNDADTAGSFPVIGDVWEYPVANTETTSGTSCSSATLSWSGRGTAIHHQHMIGSEFSELQVSGAPANSLHFMVLSLATTNQPVIAAGVGRGCRLLVDTGRVTYLGILDFRVGANVSWPRPIAEFLQPTTVYFQDWIFNGSFFTSTHRMAVDIVK